jgi:hypothetical protein
LGITLNSFKRSIAGETSLARGRVFARQLGHALCGRAPLSIITSIRKRRVGRPATGRDPNVGIRIPKQVIVVIDRMARDQHTTRAAIVREIVMKHLGFKSKL